jgi:proteic killer suppression protein
LTRSFKNRALKRFWERNDPSKLPPADAGRIGRILDLLDTAAVPQEMDAPGLRFHALTGNLAGRYAVTVRANWRITFAWDGQDAIEVDYEDYH